MINENKQCLLRPGVRGWPLFEEIGRNCRRFEDDNVRPPCVYDFLIICNIPLVFQVSSYESLLQTTDLTNNSDVVDTFIPSLGYNITLLGGGRLIDIYEKSIYSLSQNMYILCIHYHLILLTGLS